MKNLTAHKRDPAKCGKSKKIGRIIAISISQKKGTRKINFEQAELKKDFGIIGDAHAGTPDRQVSLLAEEAIEKMKDKGLKVKAGDFAENITTWGIDLLNLKLKDRLKAGKSALLEVSQIGKVCHRRCSIYYQAGDCLMPREGIFARVLKGAVVKAGDSIEVI